MSNPNLTNTNKCKNYISNFICYQTKIIKLEHKWYLNCNFF